jgi:hypothetical protein
LACSGIERQRLFCSVPNPRRRWTCGRLAAYCTYSLPFTMHRHATRVILSLSYSPSLSGVLSSVALPVGLRTGWLTGAAGSVIYYCCVQGNSVPVLFLYCMYRFRRTRALEQAYAQSAKGCPSVWMPHSACALLHDCTPAYCSGNLHTAAFTQMHRIHSRITLASHSHSHSHSHLHSQAHSHSHSHSQLHSHARLHSHSHALSHGHKQTL